MRSCSAWPCGVWIDGDQRATPDGSSFAWQHWSHTFEYALAGGPGDWRSAGFAAAGQDYNRDLLACETGLHDGPLPATASLAAATPGTAVVSALKPRGNPLIPATQPRREDGVTVRLRDISGGAAPTRATVHLPGGVAAASRSTLLEEGGSPLTVESGAAVADLPPSGTVTMVIVPGQFPGVQPAEAEPAETEPAETEPVKAEPVEAQPVFTRYWLHGKGPAPAGNLPVAVHLSPARTALALPSGTGISVGLRLTVACGLAPAAGLVALDGAGLNLEPAGPLRYDLGARGHAGWDITVTAPADAPAGRYFVTARISGDDGQVFEDAVLVTVGEPPAPALDLPLEELIPLYQADQEAAAAEISLALVTQRLELRPGEAGEVVVRLANGTASRIRGEAQLLSPFGTWPGVQPWTRAFSAAPAEEVRLSFPVAPPATARPGEHWWALVKVMYFGRSHYTDPASVTIVPPGHS